MFYTHELSCQPPWHGCSPSVWVSAMVLHVCFSSVARLKGFAHLSFPEAHYLWEETGGRANIKQLKAWMSQINNYGTTPNNSKTTTMIYCLFPPVGIIQNCTFAQTETIHSKDREMSKGYTSSHVGGTSQGSDQREEKPASLVTVGTGRVPGRVSFWSHPLKLRGCTQTPMLDR